MKYVGVAGEEPMAATKRASAARHTWRTAKAQSEVCVSRKKARVARAIGMWRNQISQVKLRIGAHIGETIEAGHVSAVWRRAPRVEQHYLRSPSCVAWGCLDRR